MKTRLLILPLLLAGLALAGCGKSPDSTASSAAGPLTIAVIPKGTNHEYWKSIHAGAVKAQQELAGKGIAVEIKWKGPIKEDDREGQIQVVETFISQHVSGIVLAPLDNKALVAPVEEAAAAEIPVVVIDSGLQTKAFASFVSTDNIEGGRIAARELGKIMEGKGNVLVLRYAVGSASTEEREAGFLDVMQKDFPAIKIISSDQHAGPTRETAKTASEDLLNKFGKQVTGIFASNESAASGMLLALRDAGLASKVKFVAFDSGELINEGLQKNEIQGMVVQNPIRMGYLGVLTAVAVIRGEKVEARIDTGVGFVTKANFNSPEMADMVNPPLDKYLGK